MLKGAIKDLLRYDARPETAVIREIIESNREVDQPFFLSSKGDLIYSLIVCRQRLWNKLARLDKGGFLVHRSDRRERR
jgi:hypothetical protein